MLVNIYPIYIGSNDKFWNPSDDKFHFTAANAQWMWSNTCDHRTRPRTRTSSRTRTRIRTRTRRTRYNNITNSESNWSEAPTEHSRCHAFATRRPGWRSTAMGTSFGLKYTTQRYGGPGRWPHHRIFVMSTQIVDHLLSLSSSTRRPCEYRMREMREFLFD